jgi:hypothetical protein
MRANPATPCAAFGAAICWSCINGRVVRVVPVMLGISD